MKKKKKKEIVVSSGSHILYHYSLILILIYMFLSIINILYDIQDYHWPSHLASRSCIVAVVVFVVASARSRLPHFSQMNGRTDGQRVRRPERTIPRAIMCRNRMVWSTYLKTPIAYKRPTINVS